MGKRKAMATVDSVKERAVEPAAAGTRGCSRGHCHYWVVETPSGPISRGVCKFCGLTREFDSFGPDSWWQGYTPDVMVPGLPDVSNKDKSG